ncbi:MAG: hypothetical protein Q9183_001375 [Haloplaca sp. 2 TL-2023]
MADTASPPNLMAYLFAKEVMNQTLRLAFAGSWNPEPELAQAVEAIESKCRTIIQAFQPVSEYDEQEGQDFDDENPDKLQEDDTHTTLRATIAKFQLNPNTLSIRQRTRLSTLGVRHPFFAELVAAYQRDYGVRRIVNLGPSLVKWRQRIAYTDPFGKQAAMGV